MEDEQGGARSVIAGFVAICGILIVGAAAGAILLNNAKDEAIGAARTALLQSTDASATEGEGAPDAPVEKVMVQEFAALPHAFGDWTRTDYIGTEATLTAFASVGLDPEGEGFGQFSADDTVSRSASVFRRGSERFLLLIENGEGLEKLPPTTSNEGVEIAGLNFTSSTDDAGQVRLVSTPGPGIRISVLGRADDETVRTFVERMNLKALHLN